MNNLYCLFCLILNFYASTQSVNSQSNITYDFSCMEVDDIDVFINFSSDFEKEILRSVGDEVSINEEVKLGNETLKKLKKDYFFDESSSTYFRVKGILSKLTAKIRNPKGYSYVLYLMNTDAVNAYTVGGKIFITKGMIDFCVSNDEIACILGHEIAHNELGHIRDGISRIKTARQYGDLGEMSADVASILTTSFNQKNEVHCDFVGVDLAISSGFKGCAGPTLWARMERKESTSNMSFPLFDTHPYSSKRETCLKQHLEVNYNVTCE